MENKNKKKFTTQTLTTKDEIKRVQEFLIEGSSMENMVFRTQGLISKDLIKCLVNTFLEYEWAYVIGKNIYCFNIARWMKGEDVDFQGDKEWDEFLNTFDQWNRDNIDDAMDREGAE